VLFSKEVMYGKTAHGGDSLVSKKNESGLTTQSACALCIALFLVLPTLLPKSPSVVHAATFTVNSTDDAIDAAPGNGVCATAGGVCTLRAAIQEANDLAGDDTIVLPTGTYTLTLAGAGEMNAATGDLDIHGNLTITGAGAPMTIINGNGDVTGDRVFFVHPGRVVTISGVTIQNGNPGSGTTGGGIANAGTLTISHSTLIGNTAGNGGAIHSVNGRTLTLVNTTVTGNSTTGGYGAIYNEGTLIMTNSIVSGNSATGDGGGIRSEVGTLTLTNSTVSGNSATGRGGGIVVAYGGTADLNNVTITNNTADSDGDGFGTGGGIACWGGTVNFRNTLIAGNNDAGGQAPDCSGTLDSQGYNLIQNTSGCTVAGDTTGNITGQDPELGPLQNNGGSTFTHSLLPGSPAIDAANPTAPGSGGHACEATDQRGVARPQGARCDIGAFESIVYPIYLPLVLR
jgi:CSLREA domain-containing protein